MNCREFEKMIPDFDQDNLTEEELQTFLEHYQNCPVCREELSIDLLIQKGLPRLENGKSFHLPQEMDQLLKNARSRLSFRKKMTRAAYGIEIIALSMVIVSVILMLMM